MRRETAGLSDRRFEKIFRSFFGERNGELSMVKKSLHRLREMAGRGLLQDVPYLREVVKLTADQWNLSGVGEHNVSSRSAGDQRLRLRLPQSAMTMSAFSGMAKTTQATSTQT